MAEFTPTPSQTQAIRSRGSAVLISAGAGSGKTKVLTERLLAWLRDEEHPADLDSFLIITFTRAAAGELRGRIMEELSAALAADPGNRHLRRQSALCRRAQIGTIHSFCAALLRENSHLAGLSPDFKIADEDRAEAMRAAALERTLERCYEKPEAIPGFLLLADTVGAGRDDSRLAALVLSLHSRMQCHARPEDWAREQVELLRRPAADAGETPWGQELLARAQLRARYWSGEMDRCLRAVGTNEAVFSAYGESFAATADAIRELERCLALGWDRARACFPIPFPKLKSLRKSPDPELSEHVKARRGACKKAMEALETLLDGDSEGLLRDMARTEPAMSALLQLVLSFDREYSQDKRRAGLVDYADLEHKTARLLTGPDGEPTELAAQVSRRYTEIMVDEYQDVSQVQDTIFRAVSREGKNLFLVGDVKQSIYRFRLADPGIFTEKYRAFRPAETAAPGEAKRILLRENFRSRREVLDAANAVFSRCMSRALGELDYDEDAALRYGSLDYSGSVPVPELTLLSLEKDEGEEEAPDKQALEAAFVAGQIRRLMAEGILVNDREGPRPLDWGDIAILLRSANSVGPIYRRELIRQGIPVGFGQGDGFFRSIEISTVLSMLAVLDNPHQDIPLIAVLRSPALGFDADSLAAIRAAAPKADFYTALTLWSREHAQGRDFLEKLERLRAIAPDLRASELVELLLEELDLLALCSAMRDGSQRRARLMELSELSERFEKTGYRGLHRFVLWLRKLAEKGQEPSLGAENASAVHILSIHKSKGLEFPVVFLADLSHSFNRRDLQRRVLIHPELGLGPKVTDLKRRVEYTGLARSAVSLRLEREMLSEELRLLYVGMTRARERLFLSAVSKDPQALQEKAVGMADTPISPVLLARAQNPALWLLAAAMADGQQHLKVSIAVPETPEEREAQLLTAAPDPEAEEALRRNLAFVYPHREAEALPSKVTATELKGHSEQDEDALSLAPRTARPFRLPDLSGARPLSATEKGTATHLVLQVMDFGKTERLRQEGFLSEREAGAVDAAAIGRLFASPLGKRMLTAPRMEREFHFSLLCEAGDFFPGAQGEQVLLQGVVDCFLEDADGITVIDYKTDRVKNRAEAEARAKAYTGQLRAYAGALERICRKPVKECLLYFLRAGETVPVAF